MFKMSLSINDKEFIWELKNSSSALMWFKLLKYHLKNDEVFYIRPHGFPGKSKPEIISTLDTALKIIFKEGNVDNPHFNLEKWSQNIANKVHHFFDDLYGKTGNETEFYNKSPKRVQWALGVVNHSVHQLETFEREHLTDYSTKSIVFEACNKIKRLRFPDSFYDDFELNVEPGSLILHYSTVGKSWIEAFVDDDQEISVEKIIPHQFFSCEFDIFFANRMEIERKTKLFNFIRSKGMDPNSKELGIGFIPLATIDKDSAETLKRTLNNRSVEI
jgi:hypothetical protein